MPVVTIEKLVFGGQGLARLNGKVVFVWNALPGETVEIQITQNKKDHIEGIATKILIPSPDRVTPQEDHFPSCSPWQILSFAKENQWKQAIAVETYKKVGGIEVPDLELISLEPQIGYRNKMEYSFAELPNGEISLAFFERGGRHHTPIDGCILASPAITAVANKILEWVNEQQIPIRSLKTMILRSNTNGEVIVGLFIKDRLAFSIFPSLDSALVGFHIFYSTHKSPASVITDTLYTIGATSIETTLLGIPLQYGLMSFFQIHLPIFEQALNDIQKFLDPQSPLLDYYAGVGAISLALSGSWKEALLVESNQEAVAYAQKNILHNRSKNAEALCIEAERITNAISFDHIMIVDPPRAGLHDQLTKTILEKKPKRIIYVSCNLATHARDIERLLVAYTLTSLRAYNFFPRTPHIEGLAILDRRP